MSKELHFPVIGENNWDAFNDWLTYLYEPFDKFSAVKIIFKNSDDLDKDVKRTFFELLKYSAEDGFVTDNSKQLRVPCYYEIQNGVR